MTLPGLKIAGNPLSTIREATQVFQDPMALTLFDQEHSIDEERWITLGLTPSSQYLVLFMPLMSLKDIL